MPSVATASVPEILFSPQLIKNTLGEDQRLVAVVYTYSEHNVTYIVLLQLMPTRFYGCKFVESENASLFSFISVI